MKLLSIVAVALIGAGGVGAAPSTTPTAHESDALTAKASRNLDAYLAKKGYPNPKKCNKNNIAVRKEWYVLDAQELLYCPDTNRSTLSSGEKLNYINAVQCMSKSPAKTPAGIAAGAKNRYDDFVVTHINQTLSIHGTVSFTILRPHLLHQLTSLRATF
jgi:tyrosinase